MSAVIIRRIGRSKRPGLDNATDRQPNLDVNYP